MEQIKGSANRQCNINDSVVFESSIVFHNIENFDRHLIMQERGKVDHKINIMPNGKKYKNIYKLWV